MSLVLTNSFVRHAHAALLACLALIRIQRVSTTLNFESNALERGSSIFGLRSRYPTEFQLFNIVNHRNDSTTITSPPTLEPDRESSINMRTVLHAFACAVGLRALSEMRVNHVVITYLLSTSMIITGSSSVSPLPLYLFTAKFFVIISTHLLRNFAPSRGI